MRAGNFEAAWEICDAVMQSRTGIACWQLPRHQQYLWNGQPLAGKRVLLRCYHGLGDTIQFIRFAPLVKSIASTVIVWAQKPLIPLLRTLNGIDSLLPLHDGSPEVEYDMDIELMELPHVFRITNSTLPSEVPYLHIEPIPQFRHDKQLQVGIVWKAGDWNEGRSIPYHMLGSLKKIPNAAWHIFQRDPGPEVVGDGFGILSKAPDLFQEARLIRSLDLLISVDTMTAHLAGAMGIPVWNLLQKNADWRWMKERCDSPWYPTMRLFRQQIQGEWEPVIATVARELKILASKSSGAKTACH